MNSVRVILLTLSSSLCCSPSWSADSDDIRNWRISPISNNRTEWQMTWKHLYYLRRPNDDDQRMVAVIAISRDKNIPELNPDLFFARGPVPKLKEMSPQDCVRVWGNEMNQAVKLTTQKYILIETSEHKPVEMELRFKNNRIEKYRLIAKDLMCSQFKISDEWIVLQNSGNPRRSEQNRSPRETQLN